ncbi:MAG: hypothetical protein QOG91_514 [Candidatus Parcubacteria bacterium]|jgi:predicted HTH domain antitoxin|nr:hypothetical protein [Candidatus Parcubacteria bacterium]
MKTIAVTVNVPNDMLLHPKTNDGDLEKRFKFLLALKLFELGDVSSGGAALMCGMSRVDFITEVSGMKIPVVDLAPEEMKEEFSNA